MHPREFVFNERGRMVSRQCSHRAPHSREIKVREAPAILSRLSSSLLPLDGTRSQEQECKLMTDRSGRRDRTDRRERERERSQDGWKACNESAGQSAEMIDCSKHTSGGAWTPCSLNCILQTAMHAVVLQIATDHFAVRAADCERRTANTKTKHNNRTTT